MIILSIRLFFLAARGMNPEGLPQLSGACLYSNPPLLLSLRVFLTPPSFGHLPYILLCKTQGRRVRVTFRSLRCNTPHTGHGKGRGWYSVCCCYSRCFQLLCFLTPPSLRATSPICLRHTGEEGEMYFPFASAPILYVTPCNVTGHGRGGVLRQSFIMWFCRLDKKYSTFSPVFS